MAEAEVEAGVGRFGMVQWMVGRRRELEWWWSSVDPCQFVGVLRRREILDLCSDYGFWVFIGEKSLGKVCCFIATVGW